LQAKKLLDADFSSVILRLTYTYIEYTYVNNVLVASSGLN